MEKLVLIDGNSLLNRAFYATPVFSTKSGNPTNAIFGFTKLLFKIIDDMKPKYLIVAFDMKAPTFRHKMFEGYKATRKGMPDELAAQVEPLKELLKEMKIATCEKEGIEADDIIGTLSKKFDVHSYIYTGDRDSYQLVDEKTDVYFTKRGVSDLLKLNIDNFIEEVGLMPKQIIDLKALMGDKSDNIPGVLGIGEKTAITMLNKYENLDNIYEHLDELSNGVQSKMQISKDMAYLSYKLATINRDCDIDIDLNSCLTPNKYGMEVKRMFSEFEFKSLMSLDVFEEISEKSVGVVYPEKNLCEDASIIKNLIKGNDTFYFDVIENTVQLYLDGKIYEFSPSETLLGGIFFDEFKEILSLIFNNSNNTVIAYDCKSIMHWLEKYNITFNCKYEDLSVIEYIVENKNSQNLKNLCELKLLNSAFNAFNIQLIYAEYKAKLTESGLENLYYGIEHPLITVLYSMERNGVKISLTERDLLENKYLNLISELTKDIYSLCGCEFNLNSPSQIGDVLFEKLGLKAGKKNKKGKYSTSAEILEGLADENEVVRLILKYRQYNKLYSTYIEGFKPLIDKRTNKVHTTFNQTVTATGRLSSTNPNIQNIPIREEEGQEIRKMFIPSDGNVFIDADYSQIELRLLAHFSGCKELINAYKEGRDVHAVTASQVFGVALDEVTPIMRRNAKAVNFGIIYGISDFGLSKNINVSLATAREYIKKYFEQYDEVKRYMDENVRFAKEHGYVCTLTGRKRTINEIKSSNYVIRQFGERAAMNMPLQGTSADIIKIAMVNVERALKRENLKAKMILQVHDELVLDCPLDEVEKAKQILKYEMENAVKLNVPLTVDVNVGSTWYEAK